MRGFTSPAVRVAPEACTSTDSVSGLFTQQGRSRGKAFVHLMCLPILGSVGSTNQERALAGLNFKLPVFEQRHLKGTNEQIKP